MPARAERRYPQCPQQLLAGVAGQIEQRVDFGDCQRFRARGELYDLVVRPDLSLGQDPEVEPRPVVCHQQRRYPGIVHPDADPVAGNARLAHLEDRAADLVAIADADHVVGETLDGEVLPELPVDEVVPVELALPVLVGVELVDEHRALLAAVSGKVALAVAVDVQAAHHPRAVDWLLPHRRVHRPALPDHFPR